MMDFEVIQKRVEKAGAERQFAKHRRMESAKKYNEAVGRYDAAIRAQEIIQRVAQQVQTRAFGCIAQVVSRCLESVFDEPYCLDVEFQRKRGRTEVSLGFKRDGRIVDPLSSCGGGVIDVASFALRLVAILLSGNRGRRLLVLDEPFKFVSANYRSRVRQMLEDVSGEMGFQIVMVTHIDEFRLGTVVELG